jgi:glycine cleavage system H protein
MPKPLVFLMGRSPVFLPTDRLYARNHFWALPRQQGYRFGFSAYAVRLLGDVKWLQWTAQAGAHVDAGQQIGFLEASKATSDLYAPVSGRITEINAEVLADPTLINSDLYDRAWLFLIDGPAVELLRPEDYWAHLEASWPLAERLLKGQANFHGRARGT